MLTRPVLRIVAVPLFLLAGVAASACSQGDGGEPSHVSEDQTAVGLSVDSIKTAALYESMSIEGGGFGQAGRSMKFLIDARTTPSTISFINANYTVNGKVPEYAKYHYYFAKQKLGISAGIEEFNENTYYIDNKQFYAGTITTYQIGEDTEPTYGIQFYPDDVIHEQGLLPALQKIKAAFTVPNAKIAFIATGPQQSFKQVGTQIRDLGVTPLTIDQVLGSVKYFPMNPGEAWGVLRIFPRDVGDLRPTDIPVFDELPLDLSVVAGTITRVYQDSNSHVNLKSKERGTPNMVLRDASTTDPRLAQYANKPVHLVVSRKGFVLKGTTMAVVNRKLQERLNKPWIPLPQVNETKLAAYEEMCPSSGSQCLSLVSHYGGKATGLGLLANRLFLGTVDQPGSASAQYRYDLSPPGFGVPVQFYRDFVNAPENATLKQKISNLITKERSGSLSPNERNALAREVQGLFYSGTYPASTLAAIKSRVGQMFVGAEKLKVRSSGNAEDIPNFDGAGLYDSFSAKPDKEDNPDNSCIVEADPTEVVTKLKVKPKTIQCALKAVYASNWNPRALDERTFARLDHATANMGIAIVRAYDDEFPVVANGVVITRVINSEDYIGYSLSLQSGNNLVTNPDPGTVSQFTMATWSDGDRPPRLTITRYAKPVQNGPTLARSVLTDRQQIALVNLAKRVETSYCNADRTYYPGGNCQYVWADTQKPNSLDIEFKVLSNGQFVVKQLRQFHGR